MASSARNAEPEFLYSPAMRVSFDAAFGIGAGLAWDAYQRPLYNTINGAPIEQRNNALLEARRPLSPFGRLYSEILKPSSDLPSFERLVHGKGSVEAVLQNVGKTRAVTDRLAATLKVAGPDVPGLRCWPRLRSPSRSSAR